MEISFLAAVMAAVAPCPPNKKVPPLFTLGSGVTLQPESASVYQ